MQRMTLSHSQSLSSLSDNYTQLLKESQRLLSSRDPMSFSALTLAGEAKDITTEVVDMSDEAERERYFNLSGEFDPSLDEDGYYNDLDAAGLSDLYVADHTQQPQ